MAASLAGCSNSTDLLQISPSWTLQTSDGHALPDTIPNSSPVIVVTSATAQINDNHNYTFTLNGTTDGVEGVVGSDAGTWSISHSIILFRSTSSAPQLADYVAAFNGNTINVGMPGQVVHSSNQSVAMTFVAAP